MAEQNQTTNTPEAGGGAPRSSVGVYDRPERSGPSPLMRILPILLAVAVLAFLAWRYLRPAPADTTQQPVPQAGQGTDAGTGSTQGAETYGTRQASPPGPQTGNPPGPGSR